MNQYFSAELSQKVKRGMNETRLKGNFTGGHLLYGYDLQDHKIVINEKQAEVVRYIYEQFSKGVYVKDIIKSLTEKGIYNNGKPFARNTVYNILKNEKYSGIFRHNEEVFDNMYPQIVPTEIYNRVRAIISNNKYGKRSVDVVYLLRNKLKCGYCGQPISAETGTSKSGKVKRYYKCLGRKRHNGCNKAMIGKECLENLIITHIVETLSDQNTINVIVNNLLTLQEKQSNGTQLLSMLTKGKRQTENSIKNIMTAIEKGVITNTTTRRLKELEEQQENLERQILIEKSKTAIKYSEQEIRAFYEQALKLEPQMLIDYIVKEILVYDDKIDIIYTNPLMISPDVESRQGFPIYSKTVELKVIQQITITIKI
ncbi:MAG: recombinase family protein [Candidatus Coproplasma sp.]